MLSSIDYQRHISVLATYLQAYLKINQVTTRDSVKFELNCTVHVYDLFCTLFCFAIIHTYVHTYVVVVVFLGS